MSEFQNEENTIDYFIDDFKIKHFFKSYFKKYNFSKKLFRKITY
jgi:hypothetical protein